MKRTDWKRKSSVYYIGKGVIILCIITSSSLGFLLGFFVGKNMQPSVTSLPSAPTPPSPEQKNTAPLKEEAAFREQTQETQSVQPPGLQPIREEQQTTVDKSKGVKETQSTQRTRKDAEEGKTGEPKKTGAAPTAVQTKESEGSGTGQATKVRETGKTTKYTVQAGAFKSASDAEVLKAKLRGKKYKASVITTEIGRHDKIYKVIVGEFDARPEAELLSIRIKKAEGLQAFVTVKN